MELSEVLDRYIQEKMDNEHGAVTILKTALGRAGHGNFDVFFEDDGEIVLLDRDKDVLAGVVFQGDTIAEFVSTEDEAVSVGSLARYNILKYVSDEQDKESVNNLFKGKKVWIIHCVTDGDNFNAHTHGLGAFGHQEFRISQKIDRAEVAYMLNSVGYSIASGHALKNGDIIKNLYEDYDILISESEDGYFDLTLIEVSDSDK